MLRIFRANSVYNFILVPIIGALLLLKTFLNTKGLHAEGHSFFTPAFPVLDLSSVNFNILILLGYLSVLIISFQLLQINARFSFIKERTFLPAYLFLFVVYALPELHFFQPVYISGIFSLMAISSIFSSFEEKNAIGRSFNAGILTGIGGLFYLSSNLLAFLIPLSIFTLRGKISWRELITPFIGLLLPWLFVFSYYFAINNAGLFAETFISYLFSKGESLIHSYTALSYFGFLLILTLLSTFFLLKQYDEEKIRIRRYFKILFIYFISSLLFLTFPFVSSESIVLLVLPLTYVFTNYLSFMRRRFWAELFFILLILISITLQFVVEWMRVG